MSVITRFAPSPTGYLHIGGARTALFNWLFAKHHGGLFRLRIEDTDRARSTPAAVDAIMDGLRWLGLHWDGDAVFQFARAERHAAIARGLLASGKAYLCYCTPAELTEMREAARRAGLPPRYDGRWRDRDPALAPPGVAPAVRIKAPQTGETVIQDLVQGEVRFGNDQLDDMILLRGDGTPTYMLSVVVDDHDMDITHVIRGDDHLNNAARQTALYQALGWDVPAFAHIPLIHGADGAKLSKRHGALAVGEYEGMGILPEAMRNYLLRLGWGHGDAEIIGTDEAIAWFGLEAVGRSPARFDLNKLLNLNGHYLRQADDRRLVDLILPRVIKNGVEPIDEIGLKRLLDGMSGLKERAKDVNELADSAMFYVRHVPLPMTDKAAALLSADARDVLRRLHAALQHTESWAPEALEAAVRRFVEEIGVGLGKVAQPLRAALTGATTSPGIFDVLAVLGREESLQRILAACEGAARSTG